MQSLRARDAIDALLASTASQRAVLGTSAIAIFALIVALIVYAIYSWIDVFELGMGKREQVLHIGIPLILSLILLPFATRNFFEALSTLEKKNVA